MAGSIMDERKSIRDSAKALKKYGSTSSHIKRQEHFIKHAVTKNDTLQGLALKYGITTEQIRRANRLWTNDSLFLRESLLIPVPSESLSSPSEVLLSDSSTSPCSTSFSPTPQSFSPTPQSFSPTSPQQNGVDDNYNDFLNKIDSAIANTKSQVMLAQGNSNFKEDDNQLFVKRRMAPMSRLKLHQQQQQQSGNPYEPQPSYQQYSQRSNSASSINSNCSDVPLVMTQGRKVRSSLQRLERQQDEMFEL